MKACRLLALAAVSALLCFADTDISNVLKGIEKRYNGAQTLQTAFSETYMAQGRRRTETGQLILRKPGRMRWEYSNPPGKLFVTDGKNAWSYSPESNRAEKWKLKDAEDLRAPMAFLLGKLDFHKDFKEFRSRTENGKLWITAIPASDKAPYSEVTFQVGPDAHIDRLIVKGQDQSTLDFTFTAEKMNPPVPDTVFLFQVPKGAEFVDSSQSAGATK